jgi:copper chaperone CopZ
MAESRELTVEVRGMTCEHCERTVAKALQSVPGVTEVVDVNHTTGEARILVGEHASRDRIERAIERAGYRARVRDDAEPTGTL